MALRNLEEQVLYLTQELEKVKQSLGNALPDPIPGPQGEQGVQGIQGVQGRQGYGIIGNGNQLPSYASNGDYFILRTSGIDGIDLVLYKCINNHWVAQYSLRGNQGPVGDSADVTANPDTAYSESLYKITVDGVTYDVLSSTVRTYLDNLQDYFQYDGDDEYFAFLKEVYFDQLVSFDKRVNFDGDVYFRNNTLHLSSLDQVVDNSNNPIVICENFNDKNGNARFVGGNLSVSTISGITFTYAKWSLSGSHIMFVLCGEVAANTTLNVDVWASVTLPDYIKNKISGVFASTNIEVKDSRAYYDDWNSINIQTVLQKTSDGVQILMIQNPTSTAIAHFRIQYDLLIDMD